MISRVVPLFLIIGMLIGMAPVYGNPLLPLKEFDDQLTVDLSQSEITVQGNDERFVVNQGPMLDRYLFRTDVPNGFLRFEIPITRYFFNSDDTNIRFTNEGLLTEAATRHVIRNQILPETALLRMRVFDVDEDAGSCPEVDLIYVNGKPLMSRTSQAKLTGANDTWSVPSFEVPISYLKFPQARGNNAAPLATMNEIAIRIDSLNCPGPFGLPAWAVQIDWGMIEITGAVRPIVMVHGWTGSPTTFQQFNTRLQQNGIPVTAIPDLDRGISLIATTAPTLTQSIRQGLLEFGVDKVNLFAHSKGGLVARYALHDRATANHVESLVVFGTPNHGTRHSYFESVLRAKCMLDGFQGDAVDRCVAAAQEFQPSRMRSGFNYNCRWEWWPLPPREVCDITYVHQPYVNYFNIASFTDFAIAPVYNATYPWDSDNGPYPTTLNANKVFWFHNHSDLVEKEDSFNCAMRLLGMRRFACDGLSANARLSGAELSLMPTSASQPYQQVAFIAGALPNSGNRSHPILIDGNDAIFNIASALPITVTLVAPNGTRIDAVTASSLANVTFTQATEPFHGTNVAVTGISRGTWRVDISGPSDTSYSLSAETTSNAALRVRMSSSSVRPNSTVTVEAALADTQQQLPLTSLAGLVRHPHGATTTITFVDNGTNGDVTAGDHRYTAQFVASNVEGVTELEVTAVGNGVQRTVRDSLTVIAQTAALNRVIRATTPDSNNNQLFDSLDIELEISVVRQGHFDVYADLIDRNGMIVTTGYFSSQLSGIGALAIGNHPIPLSFNGYSIAQHGVDGPYQLSNLRVYDASGFLAVVDVASNYYQTLAYQANQFEQPLIRLASATGQPEDRNGDGRYDQIRFTIDIQVLRTGSYTYNGRLVSRNGDEVAWAADTISVDRTGSVILSLVYPAEEIVQRSLGGIYVLRDLSIFSDNGVNEVFVEAGFTNQIAICQFAGADCRTMIPLIVR